MRCLSLIILGCCLAGATLAQTPQQTLRIQLSYEKEGQYLEQAVETIVATSKVGRAASVDYTAGRSVTMMPGFEARSGSTFVAQIKPVNASDENRLTLTVFPNPFDEDATIEYYLPEAGKVNLWVTNVQGQIVGKLVQNEDLSAGRHRVSWKPTEIASGIYIPILETSRQRATGRLVKK